MRDLLASYRSYLGGDFTIDEASVQSAPLPHASQLPRLGFPQQSAALIGDAASMINPSTGEGIAYGMSAGLLLGSALADATMRGDDLGTAAVRYEREVKKRFGVHWRSTRVLSVLLRNRRLLERLIRGYGRSNAVFLDGLNAITNSERPSSPRSLLVLLRLLALAPP